ncbi:MAG: S8 family serine peptidase [Bacteriovoracaceae bacterium]|jgi:hypothetical protein|nr:S8 family serine peptidase [Bacteriovoracaceae bacterium]
MVRIYLKTSILVFILLLGTSCVQGLKEKSNKVTRAGLRESVEISYSGSSLSEAYTNTGQITESINISISGGSFVANLANKYVISNLPPGLSSSLVKLSERVARLSITGQAALHLQENSSTLLFSLQNSAITGFLQASSAEISGNNHSINLNFIDPAKLTYSGMSFLEHTNDTGQVVETRTINLTGDTFPLSMTGKFLISNVPTGLVAIITRNSDTQLTLSLIGNAVANNTQDSISNMTVTFLDSAFNYNTSALNVIGFSTPNIAINFYSTPILSYSRNDFNESYSNDGAISDTAIIYLAGDNFASSLVGAYNITNLPAGMTGTIMRLTSSSALLQLFGNATLHGLSNNVANVTVEFLDNAFLNIPTASSFTNYIKNDISLNFFDNPVITYDNSTYFETYSNLGAVEDKTIITLTNDEFADSLSGSYTITNLPNGLIPLLNRTSSTTLELSFLGNSTSHIATDSVTDLTITFLDTAFKNTVSATSINGYSKNDFTLTFFSYPQLTYSNSVFNEVLGNDGSTTDTCTITLDNDKFSADISSSYSFIGVPPGLVPSLVRDSDTQLTLSLTGSAIAHSGQNTVSNIQIIFNETAFVYSNNISYVQNTTKSDFQMVFMNTTTLTYSQSIFTENALNNGSVTQTATITLSGDDFAASLAGKYFISNVPTGMIPMLTRDSNTQLTLSFAGTATYHSVGNSISNISLIFADAAFVNSALASSVINYAKSDLRIIFLAPAFLNYSRFTFNENIANMGAVDETSIITLTGDTFNTNIAGNYSFTNVPSGLVATLTRDSNTQLTLNFAGAAVNHYPIDNVSNIQLTFNDAIFVSTPLASDVTNYQVSNIGINFTAAAFSNDPLVQYAWHLKNIGQTNFALNNGASGQDIQIPPQTMDLSGETGNGIAIAVSDSGVEITHEDLAGNNDGANNRNYNNIQANWIANPVPVAAHGTMVTGIVAAVAENNLGSRGVAPEVDFSGFTFVGISSPNLAADLDQLNGPFDIFNYSYGFEQCQSAVLDPSFIAQLKTGVETLRLGKGTNYVKSSGNSFISSIAQTCPFLSTDPTYFYAGNSNLANDMAYPWELIVGALNAKGQRSSYSSPGANIWISAMGGEFGQNDPAIMTTDLSTCAVGMSADQGPTAVNGFEKGTNLLNPTCKYTSIMNGTSSAAPVTSGVIALMLEANPNLGYRDVRKILADTARYIDTTAINLSNPLGIAVPIGHTYEPGWVMNAAGYRFHNWYGFGGINAKDAVIAAQNTVSFLAPLQEVSYASGAINIAIPDNSAAGATNSINSASALTVESIQITPTITHLYMSEVGVEITSPSGTKSVLINLNSNMAQTNWTAELLSNAFYGETATGNWTIKVLDGVTNDTGIINNWSLKIYGH